MPRDSAGYAEPMPSIELDEVLVPIGGQEYPVPAAVATELCRLRDGVRGAAVIVSVAKEERDEAVKVLAALLRNAHDSRPTAQRIVERYRLAAACAPAGKG